jgi:hypothetical protein
VGRTAEALRVVAEGVSTLADKMLALVRIPPGSPEREVSARLDEIRRLEECNDAAFAETATLIMNLEVFPVNPDYYLETARGLDRISDIIERTSLLLEWRPPLGVEESELLESAALQVRELTVDMAAALASLGTAPGELERRCQMVLDREKAVDLTRDHYYMISSKAGYDLGTRIWLGEVIGGLDAAADVGRDITITLKVISNKLEKQRNLDVKKWTMSQS